jgi:predicted XRE-type DNA-binding protein
MHDPIPELKQRLAQAILEEIGKRNMWRARLILGIDQPEMWNLEHGRLRRFSVHKLIRLLATINRRVDITVVAVGQLPTRTARCGNVRGE